MFEVIIGGKTQNELKRKQKKEFKNKLYFKAFARKVVSKNYNDLLSAVFYGVKYINTFELSKDMTYLQTRNFFEFIIMIKNIMNYITISDLINLFPPIKTYDGKKYECKDYFSTMEYLNRLDLNGILGEEIDEFLNNYYNNDIINMQVKSFLVVDRLRYFRGEPGMLETFAEMFDVDTYSINFEDNYIVNNRTMEVSKIHPALPRYLKIVRKEDCCEK